MLFTKPYSALGHDRILGSSQRHLSSPLILRDRWQGVSSLLTSPPLHRTRFTLPRAATGISYGRTVHLVGSVVFAPLLVTRVLSLAAFAFPDFLLPFPPTLLFEADLATSALLPFPRIADPSMKLSSLPARASDSAFAFSLATCACLHGPQVPGRFCSNCRLGLGHFSPVRVADPQRSSGPVVIWVQRQLGKRYGVKVHIFG